MKKKTLTLLSIITVLAFAISGCGKNSQTASVSETQTTQTTVSTNPLDKNEGSDISEDKNADKDTSNAEASVNESKETETTMTDEEIKKYATGADSFDTNTETEASTEESWFLLNNEIEPTCPVKAYYLRPDTTYPGYIHETYYSTYCGMERGFTIVLPTDYTEDKKYPVLYMLHGIFGDEYSFSGDDSNGVRTIVTNMAKEGVIEETIVVCPNMYAAKDPDQKPGFSSEAVIPYDEFIYDLTTDLMPYIETHYSVLTGRENTYLAGFSMGGRETLFITKMRPELFGYVCAISAAPGITPAKDNFMTHVGQLSEDEFRFDEGAITPNVFISCCGTKDSVVGTFPKQYHELMEKNGMDHIWYEIEGVDHNSTAIRSGLYNLFKQIAYDKSLNN